jgi:2-polyprenyl-6-methoxyphenol hydroxylase-like FAD-dependent oxidoreductase
MIDRFGDPIRVGWPEYQILWLRAALDLPKPERAAAFQDIADMTGRTLSAVRDRAYLEAWRMRERAERCRRPMVPARAFPCPQRSRFIPSELKQPTKAQLMGAR